MNSQPAPTPSAPEPYELTDRDRQMLAFEGQWWRHKGAKNEAIRAQFDMSPTSYYQILRALILRDEALAAEPMIVRRLRRLRDERRRSRVTLR